MSDSQFDDLLGSADDDRPDIEPARHGRDFSLAFGDVHEINRGVSIPWLCQAFTMTRKQVVKALDECPIQRMSGSSKIYDLRVAAGYLVKPRINIRQYINSLEPKDLPDHLRREFWGAKLAEQRWRKQAGELWASEDVIAVFGEVFKLIKSTTQLWGDSLDNVDTLSDPQRETLTVLVDDLTGQIFKTLEDLESGKATPAQIAEADEDEEAE